MKIRKPLRRVLFLALVCALLAAGGIRVRANIGEREQIASGVFVGPIEVSGMTKEEAQEAVDAYVSSLSQAQITVLFHNEEREISLEDLGFSWENADVVEEALGLGHTGNLLERYKMLTRLSHEAVTLDIRYSWDEAKLRICVRRQASDLSCELTDASIVLDRESGEFIITDSVSDITVDINATVEAVKEAVEEAAPGEDIFVTAVTQAEDPDFTSAMALDITDILGVFSTEYDESITNRVQNLVTGCAYIDGTVLMPGEELSFFDYLYPCTAARGYKVALAYSNGREVYSLGGGICQVSTTCYNAVLLAELEVLTRSAHSMLVEYVEPGLDSNQARSSGSNLSFVNSTDYPVYVEAYAEGGTVYVALWGKETRPENRTVRYGSEYTETWPYSGKVVYEYSTSMAYGARKVTQSEYPKVVARAYKEVLIDGEVVSREYLSDTEDVYRATPTYVTVGTGGLSVSDYLAGVLPGQSTEGTEGGETAEEAAPSEDPAPDTEAAEGTGE